MADFRIDTTAPAVCLSRLHKQLQTLRYISYSYHMVLYARFLPLEPEKYRKLPRLELERMRAEVKICVDIARENKI